MRGLAELHLHLYGTIRAADYLDFVSRREVDWRFYESTFEEAYGTATPVREVLDRHRMGDPAAAADFERLFVFGDDDAGNFDRFQAKFNLLLNGSRMMELHRVENPEEHILEEVRFFLERIRRDQLAQGIAYAEQRLLLRGMERLDLPRVLRELLGQYALASDDRLVERLAISLPRDDPFGQWPLVQELALSPVGEALTGVDFCFVEEGHPPKEKREFFAAVREFNERNPRRALAILYHVGESFRDKSLESAVRWVQEAAELGAHRLGHAIALGVEPGSIGPHEREEAVSERRDQIAYDLAHAEGLGKAGVRVDRAALDAELRSLAPRAAEERLRVRYDADRLAEVRRRQDYAMECVRRTGAVVEVCPTSNRRIGDIADPSHHPVHRFLEKEIPVVVASDDPGIFGTSLAAEIDWVARACDLAAEETRALADSAWRHRSEVLSGRVPR